MANFYASYGILEVYGNVLKPILYLVHNGLPSITIGRNSSPGKYFSRYTVIHDLPGEVTFSNTFLFADGTKSLS